MYVGSWRYVGKPYFPRVWPSRPTLDARLSLLGVCVNEIGEHNVDIERVCDGILSCCGKKEMVSGLV
jgi:hypothetical protein